MRARLAFIGVLVSPTLAHAAEPSQFDYVCQTTSVVATGPTSAETKAAPRKDLRIRIDLDTKLWCAADCRKREPIKRASEKTLVLKNQINPLVTNTLSIDRHARTFRSNLRISAVLTEADPFKVAVRGTCKIEPFSGHKRGPIPGSEFLPQIAPPPPGRPTARPNRPPPPPRPPRPPPRPPRPPHLQLPAPQA